MHYNKYDIIEYWQTEEHPTLIMEVTEPHIDNCFYFYVVNGAWHGFYNGITKEITVESHMGYPSQTYDAKGVLKNYKPYVKPEPNEYDDVPF